MAEHGTRVTIAVDGMSCGACEARIELAVGAIDGVTRVKASASLGEVVAEVDPSRVGRAALEDAIRTAGYAVRDPAPRARIPGVLQALGLVAVAAGLYLALRFSGASAFLPAVSQSMGYGLILLVGLVTSVHCIGMCGGIVLSQGMAPGGRLAPSLRYNAGRVLSYTVIGGLVGGLGSLFSLSTALKGAIPIVAGAFMAVLGIRMLGIFPALSRLRIRIPGLGSGRLEAAASRRGPFVVGLLNGLMPCGPLQTMQVYALGTGSVLSGALSMFLFSIGTVPLLLGLGAASSLLSASFSRRLARASGALVVVLGLVMAGRGLNLFGVALPRLASTAEAAPVGSIATASTEAPAPTGARTVSLPAGAAVAGINGGVQEVTTRVLASSYQPFVVQQGVPVRWTIEVRAEDLNGCNNPLTVPSYGIRKRLAPGKNVVEFTPDRTGTLAYTCWMGMITSTIQVVPDLSRLSSAVLPPGDDSPARRAAIAAGLASPPAGVVAGSRTSCACCTAP